MRLRFKLPKMFLLLQALITGFVICGCSDAVYEVHDISFYTTLDRTLHVPRGNTNICSHLQREFENIYIDTYNFCSNRSSFTFSVYDYNKKLKELELKFFKAVSDEQGKQVIRETKILFEKVKVDYVAPITKYRKWSYIYLNEDHVNTNVSNCTQKEFENAYNDLYYFSITNEWHLYWNWSAIDDKKFSRFYKEFSLFGEVNLLTIANWNFKFFEAVSDEQGKQIIEETKKFHEKAKRLHKYTEDKHKIEYYKEKGITYVPVDLTELLGIQLGEKVPESSWGLLSDVEYVFAAPFTPHKHLLSFDQYFTLCDKKDKVIFQISAIFQGKDVDSVAELFRRTELSVEKKFNCKLIRTKDGSTTVDSLKFQNNISMYIKHFPAPPTGPSLTLYAIDEAAATQAELIGRYQKELDRQNAVESGADAL